MIAKKLTDKILLIEFPTIKEMTLTMFRIQEFYEGKEGIKGRYFTADQFLDAYSDERGDIDYFSYWEGFNVPTVVIFDFINKFTIPQMGLVGLSKREAEIKNEIDSKLPKGGYLIACVGGDEITLKHEMCHAYFFEDAEYKNKASEIVKSIPDILVVEINSCLVDMDYSPEVFIDEINAYLTAYDQEEWDECFPDIEYEEVKEYSEKLNELYNGKMSHTGRV